MQKNRIRGHVKQKNSWQSLEKYSSISLLMDQIARMATSMTSFQSKKHDNCQKRCCQVIVVRLYYEILGIIRNQEREVLRIMMLVNVYFFKVLCSPVISVYISWISLISSNNTINQKGSTKMDTLKISCFGAGFVGLPTSAVLAINNPNKQFVVFDIDHKRIKSCSEGIMPIYEPGLEEMMMEVKKKNLIFSFKIEEALDHASVIFLALPTPTKNFGQDAGKAHDLSYTEKAINNIINYYNANPEKMAKQVIIAEKSTVPVETGIMIGKIVSAVSLPELKDRYVITSNPEFLAEGSAIKDLMKPDRVVIGCQCPTANIENLLSLYHYTPNIIRTSSSSSQMAKLVSNCFLAQRVSSINSIAILCQSYESDVKEVRKCVGSDHRIGDNFLNSSVGFGGSCFQKDILALIYLAESAGLKEVAKYWQAVIDMNNFRKKTFFERVYNELNKNLKGKKIAIFGTAFKKNTNDARESPAIDICRDMLVEGAILNLYDPKAKKQTLISEMKYNRIWEQQFDQRLIQYSSADEAVKEVSAIVVLTEWDIFAEMDYTSFYSKVSKPAIIFDGRNILDETKIKNSGFRLCRIGKKYYCD